MWDAGHMKAGQTITAKVARGWAAPTCTLNEGALLYGHVTAAVAPKGSGEAQLGLVFDHADCTEKDRKELPLKLISVVAPPGEFKGLHTAIPTAIGGGQGRQIQNTVATQDFSDDENLNPEISPPVVHEGSVRGLPDLALKPNAGPSCSALLTKSDRMLRLSPQTRFMVVLLQDAPAPNP